MGTRGEPERLSPDEGRRSHRWEGMMKGRTVMGLATAAAMLAFGAGTVGAEVIDGPEDSTLQVRIINNHASAVRVYVESADGREHSLGRVLPAEYKALEIPERLTALGDVKIKVFEAAPAWTSVPADSGVRTQALSSDDYSAIQFWVEPDLRRSQVELIRG